MVEQGARIAIAASITCASQDVAADGVGSSADGLLVVFAQGSHENDKGAERSTHLE